MCFWHETMSNDLDPGKFPQRGVPRFILKDPSILPTQGLSPIFIRSPPPRFHRATSFHVTLSPLIHEVIQVVEDFLGDADTKVIAPASDHRIHLVDQCDRGRPHVLAPDAFEFPLHIFDGLRTRFDQPLIATVRAIGSRIMANVKRQKIEPFPQVTNMSLLV